jgi:CheY-like chemotaxis protein
MDTAAKPILIVDDDPFILDVVGRFFKAKGYRVVSTTDPEKAYGLAETEVPQLIISDIAMPGLDGFTLLQGLKGNKVTENIPLVLLTGSDKIHDIEKGFSAGAQVYLLKPVDWVTAWPKIQPLLKD